LLLFFVVYLSLLIRWWFYSTLQYVCLFRGFASICVVDISVKRGISTVVGSKYCTVRLLRNTVVRFFVFLRCDAMVWLERYYDDEVDDEEGAFSLHITGRWIRWRISFCRFFLLWWLCIMHNCCPQRAKLVFMIVKSWAKVGREFFSFDWWADF
jgi:hypothetical protein